MAQKSDRLTLKAAQDVAHEWGVAKAAWQLEDALMDTGIELYPDLPGGPEARAAHFKFVWAEVGYKRALLAMVLLSIFETPAWCRQELDFGFEIELAERCDLSEGLMTSGIPYIPPGWSLVIEVVLMGIIFRKFLTEWWVQKKFFDPLGQVYAKWTFVRFGMCCLALEAADVAMFAVFRPRFRFAFLARAGYLCLLPAVTKLVSCVVACLWDMVSVAVFLVGVILFFAWIAVTIFKDLNVGNEGFNTFRKSLNSMFIAGVSDEFVAVFLKSYTYYRWVGILWLVFLVIVHVLLLSLVLDTLCAAYMNYSEHNAEAMASRKLKGIAKAFETLSIASGTDGATVTKPYFLAFVEEFGKSPRMWKIPIDQAVVMWDAIDADGSGGIEKSEFSGIVGLIQYDFWTTTQDSFVKTSFPDLWENAVYKKFRAFVGSGDDEDDITNGMKFDGVMNLVLLANLGLVVCETYCDLHKWPEPPWMDLMELIFSFVYLGELGVKLCVISFEEYWSFVSNKFDFFTTWLLLGTSIAERLFASGISTYANMLRLLRLLRVVKNLKNLETVQFMIDTVSKLVLSAKDMLTLLGVVVFFFTMASVQAFGGDLYEGNEALEGTEYLEKHMLVLNFNDVPSAFGCWVVMLLCEYEPNFPEAVSKTSAIPWSWMIFPIFYVCGVSIVFELVKAFTIEVFMSLKNRWVEQQKRMKQTNATHEDDMVAFVKAFETTGKKLHYRIRGDPSQLEQIKEAQEKLEMEGEGSHGGSGHGHGHGGGGGHGHGGAGGGHGDAQGHGEGGHGHH